MIKGTRVLLRPAKKEDIPIQQKYYQNIDIFALNAGLPHVYPIESAEEWYQLCVKADPDVNFFAIEIEGKYLGCASLKRNSYYHGCYYYGLTIGDPDYWGKGYGSEVTKLMVDFAFQYLGARRVGLGTNSKNERAIRCFLSCGFKEEGRQREIQWINGSFADYVNMGILRREWEDLKK